MKKITIQLEFDSERPITDEDVYEYLSDLMNDNALASDIEGND